MSKGNTSDDAKFLKSVNGATMENFVVDLFLENSIGGVVTLTNFVLMEYESEWHKAEFLVIRNPTFFIWE